MILYTHPTLGVNRRWALNDPLTTDMATYLRWFDRPVPGTQLAHLGMMARVFIGTLVNQPRRPWGLITEMVADRFRRTVPLLLPRRPIRL